MGDQKTMNLKMDAILQLLQQNCNTADKLAKRVLDLESSGIVAHKSLSVVNSKNCDNSVLTTTIDKVLPTVSTPNKRTDLKRKSTEEMDLNVSDISEFSEESSNSDIAFKAKDDQNIYESSESLSDNDNLSEKNSLIDEDPYKDPNADSNSISYWINENSHYISCIEDSFFSLSAFDFGFEKTKYDMTPWEVIDKCAGMVLNKESLDELMSFIENFTSSIFVKMGDIYPYLMPENVAIQIVSKFITLYPGMATYYKQYYKTCVLPKIEPNSEKKVPHQEDVNIFLLMKKQLLNKFRTRATDLRQKFLWVYQNPVEQKNKENKIVAKLNKQARQAAKRLNKTHSSKRVCFSKILPIPTATQATCMVPKNFNYAQIKLVLLEKSAKIYEEKQEIKLIKSEQKKANQEQDKQDDEDQEE